MALGYPWLLQTTTAAVTTLQSLPLQRGLKTFDLWVVAYRPSDGSCGFFRATGGVKNLNGTAALVGTPTYAAWSDVGAWAMTVTVSGGNLVLQVQGDATTVDWTALKGDEGGPIALPSP